MTIQEQIDYCKKRIAKGQDVQELRAIMESLIRIAPEAPEDIPAEAATSIFQAMVEVYRQFMEANNVPFFMDGVQGKALKAIIKKLRAVPKIRSNDAALLAAWKYIFEHWEKVGPFLKTQKSLSNINKNLTEILDKIRNEHSGKAKNNQGTIGGIRVERKQFGKL